MPLIGVRELREQTAEVLRRVREDKAEYVITYQGHPIALLLPVNEELIETAIVAASRQVAENGGLGTYRRVAAEPRQPGPQG